MQSALITQLKTLSERLETWELHHTAHLISKQTLNKNQEEDFNKIFASFVLETTKMKKNWLKNTS